MSDSVYILFSTCCNRFYTGQTQGFDNRFIEHNAGETKSIKKCAPWTLVWKTELPTRADAMKLEKKIKSRGASRFLADLGIIIK